MKNQNKNQRLAQDTFQLPSEDKTRVSEIAEAVGSMRGGKPSRSAVYKEMVRFVIEHLDLFLKWRTDKVANRLSAKGGGKSRKS